MTWAMIGAAAVTAAPSVIGSKQLGSPAPPPTIGQSGGAGGLLGQQIDPDELMRILTRSSEANSTGALAAVQNQNPDLFAKPETGGPPNTDDLEAKPDKLDRIKGFLGQFGKGIDATLESPSKQLGIGLLGQIDPRLSLAGLVAGGLFGGR